MNHTNSKVLLISGHPDLKRSIANHEILKRLQTVSPLSVHKLDQACANYSVDVSAEQALLVQADIIIFQFPLYWSTYPALMKLWFDEVFCYNFAFGPKGDQLKHKKVIISITCGATENSYQAGEFNFLPLEQYLQAAVHPIKAAQMDIVDTIISFEMNSTADEGGNQNTVIELSQQHAERLINSINHIQQ
ncbi:NAD(P)H-dependent oxidoreductase [Shewanella sp. D64]|uniref:NAD(P)H-dependent oxidoreductase n=1 Tax=unclassified Shewanella TaxID=196818 RepID=UPI0022BA36AF|nr:MULTISPECIES: NAD(P)H-dependent oxidoreductase [unclassified Shewanella]MEC4727705.1 NAD(P)H-dependent oxidoreductase [Shewanella sp. D64]MEC4739722.1 NAD(P)H-dependent oxidoreductase [Shewanella sp. E94]WBJ94099.1 NAD(P)H-dependent oxidoreductase [Shewanella sp. MTB7]